MQVIDYSTVYEISTSLASGINPFALMFLLIGIPIYFALLYRKRYKLIRRNRALLASVISSIFTVAGTILLFSSFWNHTELCGTYLAGNYDVVEGLVEVLRTQPESGHAPGDLIRINNKEIEIDYYENFSMPGYKKTLAKGGVLKNNVQAKLSLVNDVIVKIEIRDVK